MCDRIKLLAILAGATDGAVAIAGMEAFSARAVFPLVAIPFATSIVTVPGSPKGRAGTATRPDRWPPRLYVRWAAHCQTLRPGTVGGGACGRTGDGRNASDRDVSPPAGIDPLVVVVNNMSWDFLVAPVGIGAMLLALFASALAQSARARGQQG